MNPGSNNSLTGKIETYLQIIAKDPHSTAFVPLAEAYRQLGLLDDALQIARFGTENLPHFCPGFAIMGRVLCQMGRFSEAADIFARALDIDDESQSTLLGLARLHLSRSEQDQAREILQRTVRLYPEDETARAMLAVMDLPRPWLKVPLPSAGQPLPVAVESEREDAPIPTATLAEIYVKQGLTDKAIAVYRHILKENPEHAAARQRLDRLLAERQGGENVKQPVTTSDTSAVIEAPVTAVVTNATVEPKPSALTILESWLLAIRQRRADV